MRGFVLSAVEANDEYLLRIGTKTKKTHMNIYIRSAGAHPNQGYDWWKLSDPPNKLIRENPGFVDGFGLSWFDDDQLSVLLRLYKQQLHLLVTGLPTKDRTDFAGRSIRNDIAFSAADNSQEEEKQLRHLTAAFMATPPTAELPNDLLQVRRTALIKDWKLVTAIDACIRPTSSTDPSGFQVDSQSLHKALEESVKTVRETANSDIPLIKIDKLQVAKDSFERRQDVISWLISDRSLPDHLEDRKVLILVAPYPGLPEPFSENAQYLSELQSRHKEVWCQLTNVVSWKDWRIIEPTTTTFIYSLIESAIESASNTISNPINTINKFGNKFGSSVRSAIRGEKK